MQPVNDKVSRGARLQAIEAVVIGGSAGALEPIAGLLQSLPDHFELPVIIVIHLREGRESHMREVLQQRVDRPVLQAEDKQAIAPRAVYVAGASYHLSVEPGRSFSLSDESPQLFSRPSIDLLFRSAADVYGRHLAAFLFSGTSNDGAEGLAQVGKSRGLTVVQNPDDAAFATMPKAAIRIRQPDWVLPSRDMPSLLRSLGKS